METFLIILMMVGFVINLIGLSFVFKDGKTTDNKLIGDALMLAGEILFLPGATVIALDKTFPGSLLLLAVIICSIGLVIDIVRQKVD